MPDEIEYKETIKPPPAGFRDPFSFIGQNKLKAFLLFVFFWILFYFLIPEDNSLERIMPTTVAAGLSTIMYSVSFFFISYLYNGLKTSLSEVKEVSLSDKIGFGLVIAITAVMAPSFIKTLIDIVEGDISLLVLIIVLFLIPFWIIFSVIIKKMLNEFYKLAVIFILLAIISGAIFFNAPFFENISRAYNFLTGFLNFISVLFFPAFLVSIIFIEIPNLLRKKPSGSIGGL